MLTARIARPKLPKGVFEYRSDQARSPAIEEFIFDENNRLVGRRAPYHSPLSGIPEHAESVGAVDFLSVGGVTALDTGVTHISGSNRASSSSTPDLGLNLHDLPPGSIARRSVTTVESYVILSASARRSGDEQIFGE